MRTYRIVQLTSDVALVRFQEQVAEVVACLPDLTTPLPVQLAAVEASPGQPGFTMQLLLRLRVLELQGSTMAGIRMVQRETEMQECKDECLVIIHCLYSVGKFYPFWPQNSNISCFDFGCGRQRRNWTVVVCWSLCIWKHFASWRTTLGLIFIEHLQVGGSNIFSEISINGTGQ